MDNKVISIIVPIYNVEAYLDECVESILAQTYSHIQVILVDDGSTDNSGKKCDEWKEKDSRIIVIHKENGGLADARNAGMKLATGDYIGFVDSDDYIARDMYEKLLLAMNQSDSEAAICGYSSKEEEVKLSESQQLTYEIFVGRDLVNATVFQDDTRMTYSVWRCLLKRGDVIDLEFPFGKLYEDVCYYITTFWKIKKVAFVSQNLYFYRLRNDSITGVKVTDRHIDDLLLYSSKILDFYRENGNNEENSKAKSAVLKDVLSYRWICKRNKDSVELCKKIDSFIKKEALNIRLIDGGFVNKLRFFRYRYL